MGRESLSPVPRSLVRFRAELGERTEARMRSADGAQVAGAQEPRKRGLQKLSCLVELPGRHRQVAEFADRLVVREEVPGGGRLAGRLHEFALSIPRASPPSEHARQRDSRARLVHRIASRAERLDRAASPTF